MVGGPQKGGGREGRAFQAIRTAGATREHVVLGEITMLFRMVSVKGT